MWYVVNRSHSTAKAEGIYLESVMHPYWWDSARFHRTMSKFSLSDVAQTPLLGLFLIAPTSLFFSYKV